MIPAKFPRDFGFVRWRCDGIELRLPKYSVGVGDRFAHQAKAQLAACIKAAEAGVEVVPVWNKSNREHMIIGSEPSQTRGRRMRR